MRRIITLFDYTKYPHVPLLSLIIDKTAKWHYFYLKGTHKTIYEIENNIIAFRELFNEPCMINDFKSHVQAFNLPRNVNYDVYDIAIPLIKIGDDPKKSLIAAASEFKQESSEWMKIRANASVVYQVLENTGILFFNVKKYPIYHMDTFSGRSSTTGFNVQGTSEKDEIRSMQCFSNFVHLDWLSADLRMAAIMSDDDVMLRSFEVSDPYDFISEATGDRRDLVKRLFLKSLYSFKFDHPVFEVYPKFKDFLNDRLDKLRSVGYLESILGRRFYLKGDRNELSVFNAQFQGSVAHMMHFVLINFYKLLPEYILTEMHDSIVMSCSHTDIKSVVDKAVGIMVKPMNYVMPVKVSSGTKWKEWQECLVRRS